MREDVTYLNEGEYITGVGGRFGSWGDAMSFTTSNGRTIFGGGMGGNEYTCEIPSDCKKPYFVGFDIGIGGHLHNITGQFIDLDKAPKLAEQIGKVEKKELTPEVKAITEKPINQTNFADLVSLDADIQDKIKKQFWLSDSHGTKDAKDEERQTVKKYREVASNKIENNDPYQTYV